MKEIGSIFEINTQSLFNSAIKEEIKLPFMAGKQYNLSWFNTGRAAIELLLSSLRKEGKKRVWLPSFNCSSVYEAAIRSGLEISFYPVGENLAVPSSFFKEHELYPSDIVYVINFFGTRISGDFLAALNSYKEADITVVEDLTLAIFSSPSDSVGFGDYIIGSIRKWLPIPDGAFLASKEPLHTANILGAGYDYSMYYLAAQLMKAEYLKNASLDKNLFLDISNKGMKALFSDYAIREMSIISERMLLAIDFGKIINRRNSNYDTLYYLLNPIEGVTPLVKRRDGVCPLGMIVFVNERDALFKHLINNGVYCNIHWHPNECTKKYESSTYLAEHCITIPCDQRYGKEDMNYIYNVVSDFFK